MSKKHRNKQHIQKQQLRNDKAEAFGFIQKINLILAKIRETNVGMMETSPSTDPTKKSISKVLFPPEGGVLTYFDGEGHPAKGFCYGETVATVDEVKKTGMSFLRGFFGGLKQNKAKMILFVFLFRKQFMAMAIDLLAELDNRMARVRQKPERYCTCVREIYRVFNLMMIWYPDWKEILEHLRNIICMILEYDDAYRYPFQDVMAEFDKDACRKDVLKEIRRIMDIVIDRDRRGLSEKFGRIKKLMFLLRFNKSLKEALRRFFLGLDLDRIKMDEADNHHARYKWGYNWEHEENYKP